MLSLTGTMTTNDSDDESIFSRDGAERDEFGRSLQLRAQYMPNRNARRRAGATEAIVQRARRQRGAERAVRAEDDQDH